MEYIIYLKNRLHISFFNIWKKKLGKLSAFPKEFQKNSTIIFLCKYEEFVRRQDFIKILLMILNNSVVICFGSKTKMKHKKNAIENTTMFWTCVLLSNGLAWLLVQRLCCASCCYWHAHMLGRSSREHIHLTLAWFWIKNSWPLNFNRTLAEFGQKSW